MTDLVVPGASTPDWPTVLTYLGLPPEDPATRALVLLCDRYGLDPLFGHARIIGNRGAFVPYITRDGMIEVAHRSGQLDGIVVDEQRRNSSSDGWTAFVAVWRKDMSHPFRYGAQCKDSEGIAKQGNGPEMAVARAERRALKRAFRIPTVDELEPGDLRLEDDGPAVLPAVDVDQTADGAGGQRPADVGLTGPPRPPAADTDLDGDGDGP